MLGRLYSLSLGASDCLQKYWSKVFLFLVFVLPASASFFRRKQDPKVFRAYFLVLICIYILSHLRVFSKLSRFNKCLYSLFFLAGVVDFLLYKSLNIMYFYVPVMLECAKSFFEKKEAWLTDRLLRYVFIYTVFNLMVFHAGRSPTLGFGSENLNYTGVFLMLMGAIYWECRNYYRASVLFVVVFFMQGNAVIAGVLSYILLVFLLKIKKVQKIARICDKVFNYWVLMLLSASVAIVFCCCFSYKLNKAEVDLRKEVIIQRRQGVNSGARGHNLNMNHRLTPYVWTLLTRGRGAKSKEGEVFLLSSSSDEMAKKFSSGTSLSVRLDQYQEVMTMSFWQEVLWIPNQKQLLKGRVWRTHCTPFYIIGYLGLFFALVTMWKIGLFFNQMCLEARLKAFALLWVGMSFGVMGHLTFFYFPILAFLLNEIDLRIKVKSSAIL